MASKSIKELGYGLAIETEATDLTVV